MLGIQRFETPPFTYSALKTSPFTYSALANFLQNIPLHILRSRGLPSTGELDAGELTCWYPVYLMLGIQQLSVQGFETPSLRGVGGCKSSPIVW